MQVTINGEKAEITLERERTVGDFLSGLAPWLENSGFGITGIATDGTVHALDALEILYGRELSGIETMDIRVSPWVELRREAFLVSLAAIEAFETAPPESRGALELEWKGGASAAHLRRIDTGLFETMGNAFHGDRSHLTDARTVLMERLSELDEPFKALGTLNALLEEAALRLEDIPLDLQTGKDGRAAKSITLFTFATDKFFRLIPILALKGPFLENATIADLPFKNFITELSSALRDLLEAYESRDTVLVGDLAEYEIAPRIKALCRAISEIIQAAA